MYMKKHEGFLIGLNRVDVKKINPDYAQANMDELLHKYDKVLASAEFKAFIPFRNLLSKMCLLSLLYRDVVRIEESIAKKEEEIQKNIKEIESKEALLKHMDIQESLKEDLDIFKNE